MTGSQSKLASLPELTVLVGPTVVSSYLERTQM